MLWNPGEFPDPELKSHLLPDGWVSNTDGCVSRSVWVTVVGWVREKQGIHRLSPAPITFCCVHVASCGAGSLGEGDGEKHITGPECFWSAAQVVQRSRSRLPGQEMKETRVQLLGQEVLLEKPL